MLPVLSCPWRTSLCVVFVAELSYHSLVLFFRSGVTYVLYLNMAKCRLARFTVDKRAES